MRERGETRVVQSLDVLSLGEGIRGNVNAMALSFCPLLLLDIPYSLPFSLLNGYG